MSLLLPIIQASVLTRYRPWFYAAAVYNLIWDAVNILFPQLFFDLAGMPRPNYTALWQVVGMFVLVYAPAYWWAARYPERHTHLIVIGLLGKVLGPIGFMWSAFTGQLPLAFGWTILTNDLIWWPAFALYLRDAARERGGLRLLLGE
ncbi:MAG: alkyl hydroperoxide reductase [Anaerolineales bacterium]